MAVSNENSTQYELQNDNQSALNAPDHGKVRVLSFEHTQAVAGDANSISTLIKLPAGRIRVLTNMSKIATSAFGSSRVLSVGFAAYEEADGTPVTADPDYFASAVDVANATSFVLDESTTPALSQELNSKNGIVINATTTGGTIPAAATIKGYILYVVE
jgi:hypothetical protein